FEDREKQDQCDRITGYLIERQAKPPMQTGIDAFKHRQKEPQAKGEKRADCADHELAAIGYLARAQVDAVGKFEKHQHANAEKNGLYRERRRNSVKHHLPNEGARAVKVARHNVSDHPTDADIAKTDPRADAHGDQHDAKSLLPKLLQNE